MPIYEYRCSACGHELEKIQRMSDAPLTDCPECGKSALQRLVSAAGFRLKGGGWYETDFKKDKQRNLHGEKEGAKKDDAKKDAKPAVEAAKKTDSKPAGNSKSSAG